jgi:hypothetical protein
MPKVKSSLIPSITLFGRYFSKYYNLNSFKLTTSFDLMATFLLIDPSTSTPVEPSRAHLKAVQSVAKVLVESPNLEAKLNVAWVRTIRMIFPSWNARRS